MIQLLTRTRTGSRSAGIDIQRKLPWRNVLFLLVALASGMLTLTITSQEPLLQLGANGGGPFWHLPAAAWVGVSLIAALCIFVESHFVRLVATAMFGLVTMGALGLVEPLGVFHDSWQNVGIGGLAVSAQAEAASKVPYLASSPGAFLLFGALGGAFVDTPAFLRIYPSISVLLYCAGAYMLATAFADSHKGGLGIDRVRFGLMSAFAFLLLGPLFYVRINPAPQSVAFALMPFCLAAVLRGSNNVRFRIIGLFAFAAIVVIHPITALMTTTVCIAWLAVDWLVRRKSEPVMAGNSVTLYICLFVSWMVYVGIWVISTGGAFFTRILAVLNSGQQAKVTASSAEGLQQFIWVHRIGLAGGALLVLGGLVMLILANRAAGTRMAAWFAISAAWLPLLFFGEFGDRGPLFALVPASLAAGYLLTTPKKHAVAWALGVLVLATAATNYVTAYPNHAGEVIMQSEVAAFKVIAGQSSGHKISYGYAPPLTGDDLKAYANDQLRIYAIGAADFSYDRLTKTRNVIVISTQMREAAKLRGPRAEQALQQFEQKLLEDEKYDLIYDDGEVRAFRAR